ncbi:hypothetical protein [Crocosphaera sp.]|uniref:hypothetical protein n=1 Tax=Crocosphaera sp. TaxID=2729996 RepID=UPI00260D1F73|nr:hypothetical protein [Crocosphaera sp.]MDJ0580712.1 hypothetical protein [Crocosphaera sp.]
MSDNPEKNTPTQGLPVISVTDLAKGWSGSLAIEDPTDKAHRLKQEAYEACHRRWRLNFIIFVAILGLCSVFYLCFSTLTDPKTGINDKRWATVFVSSIVTGSIGFLTGKAIS